MKKIFTFSLAMVMIFTLSGCVSLKKSGTSVGNLGGVFLSEDRGENWKNASLLMVPSGSSGNIANVDSLFVKIDPTDDNALYLSTREHGIYYSYNSGVGWNKMDKITDGLVRDLVVDPNDKCRLYGAFEVRFVRSEDCGRNWKMVYFSDNNTVLTTALAINPSATDKVWGGLSDGTLLLSSNQGVAWKVIKKLGSRIQKIVFDPFDNNTIYVATAFNGIWKSIDNGESWTDLSVAMKDFSKAQEYADFVVSPKNKGLLISANKYGLLRSLDGGTTWSEIKLLTRPNNEIIYALAVDPTNVNYIYYTTNAAFYKTLDGGANWTVKRLPTSRIGSSILIHPKEPNKIFVAVKNVEQN